MRCSTGLMMAVAAGVLMLAASAQAQECKMPGCATCVPLTPAEIAAWQAKKEAKIAKYIEKKNAAAAPAATGGRHLLGNAPSTAVPTGGPGSWPGKFAVAGGAPVPGMGKWNGSFSGKWNGTHGGKWNATKYKCTACANETTWELKEGRCVCKPGLGWIMPAVPVTPANFKQLMTSPKCEPCPAGTASGPGLKAEMKDLKAKYGKTGARRLMGAGHKWGPHGSFCFPCPSGKSSPDGTSCLP